MTRGPRFVALATLAVALGCGSTETQAGSSSATDPAEAEGTSEAAGTPAAQACQRASDCAPDHNCVPDVCVLRSQAVLDQVCEEAGPPIGACECIEGECREVPFDAPGGRNEVRGSH